MDLIVAIPISFLYPLIGTSLWHSSHLSDLRQPSSKTEDRDSKDAIALSAKDQANNEDRRACGLAESISFDAIHKRDYRVM